MDLEERKREKQGIQAFSPFVTGPTIKKFFMFFFFFKWWLLLPSSCGSVIWCRNYDARTRLSVKSTV